MSIAYFDASCDVSGLEKPKNVVIIAHSASALDSITETSQLGQLLVPGAIAALKFIGKDCKPGKESCAKGETFLPGLAENSYQRVALGLLPTAKPSRHAAPGHPFSVRDLVSSLKGNGKELSIFLLTSNPDMETFSCCCAIARAFPTYHHKSKSSGDSLANVKVYTGSNASLFESSSAVAGVKVSEIATVASSIQAAASLVDQPPNELTVDSYVDFVKKFVGDIPSVSIKVIRGEELKNMGLGGIYGVGKASVNPPALVILSHNTSGTKPSICINGKGITYDTGGLSIKSKTGMPGMKMDMGGSAGVLGAFKSLVVNGGISSDVPFHCLLAIAENAVASNATRPDDIHTFYSGKTVEINNTDAEGRLVLADAMAYCEKHLNAGLVLDMATLTGAQGAATGVKHAAIVTNSEVVEVDATICGRASGDLTAALPYAPEFFRHEFKSPVADMKNSQKNRGNGGCIAPAVFLSNHISNYLESGKAWIHVDMASPAFSGERGTGYGVALLFLFLRTVHSKL